MNEITIAVLLVLIFFFSPLLMSIKALRKAKKFSYLEDEIQFLKKEIKNLKEGIEVTTPVELTALTEPAVVEEEVSEPKPEPVIPVQSKSQKKNYKIKMKWKWKWNQERLFAFLGAFLGIIGLIFLTLYLGTRIGIFARFLIMSGFSLALLFISFPLGKKEKWDELSHISRSLSGALFLFAVFASSTIEGLKWIDHPLPALVVISIGTLYNLFLGGLCRKKGYMVFHMVINFLVIFLLPAEALVFWLAFMLTLGLQIFGHIRKEELNSSLSFLLFTIYCLFYKETAADFSYFSWCFNAVAIISFISFILDNNINNKLHKVISYALPVIWIGTASVLADSHSAAVIPLVSGTLMGALLRIRKTKDLKELLFWPLQILVSGTFLILASGDGTQYWLTLLYVESAIFTYWMIKEKEYNIIPLLLNFLILISAVIYAFSSNILLTAVTIINRTLLMGSASYFMLKVSIPGAEKSRDFNSLINIFQFILPLLAFFLSFHSNKPVSLVSILFFIALVFLVYFISSKDILKNRSFGIWFASVFPLLMIIYRFINEPSLLFYESLFLILPLLSLILVVIIFNRKKNILFFPDLGVFLFSLILIVSLYFPFWKISSILPGVLLLLASFLYLILWEKKNIWEVQISGLVFLVLFFLRHITHHLQMENYWGVINIRLIIEIAALSVFYLYLKSSRWADNHRIPVLNKTLQGTAFTLSWMFLLVLIFSHSNRNILSMVFQLSIILLLFVEKRKYLPGYPLTSLAYIHFLFAQVNLALNTHPSFPFLPKILQNPWVFGFVNLGTSVFIVFLFFRHTKNEISHVSPVFKRMKRLTSVIMAKKNLTLLIPLFISLGLFFNWTLEATALTIALFCGCFLLYGTALILKENVFRHATSLALLGTSLRLIFWDLAQSTMLAKSIAFLGASIIFIVINILYSQFKGRFENV